MNSDSGSDSDAPEAISTEAASKAVSQEVKNLLAFQEEKKRKSKERRREIDRRLKAQKEVKQEKAKEKESKRGAGLDVNEDGDDDAWGGVKEREEHEEDKSVKRMDEDDDEIPGYLPDDIFEKAAAEEKKRKEQFASLTESDERESTADGRKRNRSRRKKRGSISGDIIQGDRVLRKIEKPELKHLALISLAAPPKSSRKFLKSALGLSNKPHSGMRPRGGRYQRRPVNLGVLRGDGPAIGFNRSLQV